MAVTAKQIEALIKLAKDLKVKVPKKPKAPKAKASDTVWENFIKRIEKWYDNLKKKTDAAKNKGKAKEKAKELLSGF